PRLGLEIDVSERLTVVVARIKAGVQFLDGPRRREAARGHSSASRFVERSAKLFDKGARRLQIGKAPAVITLSVAEYCTSKSGREAARLVKTNNLTVQFDNQSVRGDRHLDNKGVFPLIGSRLTAAIK